MKTAYLFGHSGSINRGCEAIVRSTAHILKKSGVDDVNLFIGDQTYDKKLGVDEVLNFVPLKKYNDIFRGICYVLGRKKIIFPSRLRHRAQVKKIKNNNMVFTVGGDTYCYGFPYNFAGFNYEAKSKGITNVLWGCSIDERIFNAKQYINDINNYSFIVARETLSFELLKKALKDKNKLFLACDPAFNLQIKETSLPINFLEGNTVGINLSHMVFDDYKDDNDIMRKNIFRLIDHILNNTDMNICLIPHVYDIDTNVQDIAVIKEFVKKYEDNNRISIVDKNLSCEELKYIISKCRFFVGARTHSIIAAYSTSVPALALGYSIKARGIAKDLYGDEDLVVSYKSVKREDQVMNAFKSLTNREAEISEIYSKKLENYKKTIFDVVAKIIEIKDKGEKPC